MISRLHENDLSASVCVDFEMTQKRRKDKFHVYLLNQKGDLFIDHGIETGGNFKNMGRLNSLENEFVQFHFNHRPSKQTDF